MHRNLSPYNISGWSKMVKLRKHLAARSVTFQNIQIGKSASKEKLLTKLLGECGKISNILWISQTLSLDSGNKTLDIFTLLSLIDFFLTQHCAQRYFSKHTQIVMDPPAPLHHFDLYFDCSLTKIIHARVQSGRWMKYLSYRCEKTPPPPKQALSCISCASLPAPIFSAPR